MKLASYRVDGADAFVAFCSDFTALAPGDVLEVEITGIGTLRTRIVDEQQRA